MTRWTADFVHATKRYGSPQSPGVRVLHAPAYQTNASPRRMLSHAAVAFSAARAFEREQRSPEVIFCSWTPVELGKVFAQMGVLHALYTDVTRDGDLSGVNVEATADLAQQTGLHVIASGGVASLDDVRRCRETGTIAGVIIGKALYSEAFTLEEAVQTAGEK